MNIRENLMDIATVFWRDWVVLKRRLAKFILSRMVAPMLYLVAFGWGLGRSIEVSSGTYLDFLVPGILALNSMNISFNSITPVHAERIYHKSLEEYTIAPIWPDAFLIGKVAAGEPILAQEHIESHYQVDPALFHPRADFLLRVQGMSMKNIGIMDGDLLAVHKTQEVRNGQVVVARLDEDVTVKRFQRKGSQVWLLPENEELSPIEVDLASQHLTIEGLAVGVIRNADWM